MKSLSTIAAKDRNIPLWVALIPLVVLIGLLVINVILYGADATYGANQIALLLAAGVGAVFGIGLGIPFREMMEGVIRSLESSLSAMILLLLIGSLTGTWMISGVVPAMVYYGLDLLNPSIFLVATVAICSIVSLATGSSWSTVATVGLALLGIGNALGINEAMTAGAIISGAYFGDKISPLSDTTNLAAAMAGAKLFDHVRYMLWTTIPSLLITFAVFAVIGLTTETAELAVDTNALKDALASHFYISPILFLVPAAVLAMVVLKVDAIAAMFIGVLLGGVFAIAFQPDMVRNVSGMSEFVEDATPAADGTRPKTPYAIHAYSALMNSMANATQAISQDELDKAAAERESILMERARAASGIPDMDFAGYQEKWKELEMDHSVPAQDVLIATGKLTAGKGMQGMLVTIWLIVTAMCFGGIMEGAGFLKRITQPLVAFARSDGSLIATTTGSCVFVNVTASDQYLAIVVPGRMFRDTFRQRGLHPKVLSRTLEDAGTVTSVLVPWNTCGATQQAVLGVNVLSFAPWCIFNIVSPFMTMLYGYLNIRLARISDDDEPGTGKSEA
jgi:Na+:H+ antiporter, NhaC family